MVVAWLHPAWQQTALPALVAATITSCKHEACEDLCLASTLCYDLQK